MSRTKTNRRTDRERYTRSNGATARLLTLVKPAETLARDWPNKNERREMMTSTITLLSTDSTTCTYSTDYCQRLTFRKLVYYVKNLEQTPLHRNQQLPALYKRLIDEIKQNYLRENDWTTDNLTNNRQLFDCDNRQIETYQLHYKSL